MSEPGWVVAVVGAASAAGREVQAVAVERGLAVAEWRLFDTTDEGADLVPEELPAPLRDGATLALAGADVVFLCGPPGRAAEALAGARAAGAVAIDVVQSLSEAEVQLLVPEVNSEVLDEADGAAFACPAPGATALAVILKPIDAVAEVKRVVVTALEPVSHAGQAGVDVLAQQVRALLSGVTPETGPFPHRLAFNLVPRVGSFAAGGRTTAEWQIEWQLRRLLDLPDLPVSVTCVCAPTFFGQAYAVNVETERPLDAEAARQLLRAAPGVLLTEPEDVPTLVDAIGSDATLVGRLRDDCTVPHGLALWVVLDGLHKGAAVNAVQIAERVLRERS